MRSGDPCPNCNTPLRASLFRRYGMRIATAAAFALGLVASIMNSGHNHIDTATQDRERYINTKCRKCGETYPLTS